MLLELIERAENYFVDNTLMEYILKSVILHWMKKYISKKIKWITFNSI